MKTSTLVLNIILIAFFAILLAPITGVHPAVIFPVLFIAGVALGSMRRQNKAALFDGLSPEVWIPLVKENPYPDNSFLYAAYDMSSFVNYDKINFAEAGADPSVIKNNTDFPIAANVATDVPKSIELDYYDTDSTIVRNAIAIELAYDQRKLYAEKHKKKLMQEIGKDAAWAYAPASADATKGNTVLKLGATDSIIDATIDLQKAYNEYDQDGSNRNLIYSPAHLAAIAKEDKVLYKSIMAEPGAMFYGFKIWTYSRLPFYIKSTSVKVAQNVAFDAALHAVASVAFVGDEVMKAMGTVKLFSKLDDPDIKGDKFNFQMRALVSSLRGKLSGAIFK